MSCLSRILVHKQEAAQADLRDSYAWHQALWKAFPGKDGQTRDFLFRIDAEHPDFRVLLLSREEPVAPTWGRWQTKPVANTFLEHETYRFQLKANPTMRRSADKRRLGIYAEDRLREWMARKAEQNGFAVAAETLLVGAPIEEAFVREKRRGKHLAVDFRGVLRVADRAAFKQAFHAGIGSAKSFGFGLLMLEPIK